MDIFVQSLLLSKRDWTQVYKCIHMSGNNVVIVLIVNGFCTIVDSLCIIFFWGGGGQLCSEVSAVFEVLSITQVNHFRCGFAGENGPRAIVSSEVKRQKTGMVSNNQIQFIQK